MVTAEETCKAGHVREKMSLKRIAWLQSFFFECYFREDFDFPLLHFFAEIFVVRSVVFFPIEAFFKIIRESFSRRTRRKKLKNEA